MSISKVTALGRKIPVRDNSYQYCGYYLIDHNSHEYLFHDWRKAISFCEENELDPNTVIQTNSPEIFVRCKELALSRLKELDIAKDLLQKKFYEAIAESEKMSKTITELEERLRKERSLHTQVEVDLQKEYRIRQSGVVHGLYEAMKALDTQRDPYWKIVYNVQSWRKR